MHMSLVWVIVLFAAPVESDMSHQTCRLRRTRSHRLSASALGHQARWVCKEKEGLRQAEWTSTEVVMVWLGRTCSCPLSQHATVDSLDYQCNQPAQSRTFKLETKTPRAVAADVSSGCLHPLGMIYSGRKG